jgi:hypothetical protein
MLVVKEFRRLLKIKGIDGGRLPKTQAILLRLTVKAVPQNPSQIRDSETRPAFGPLVWYPIRLVNF